MGRPKVLILMMAALFLTLAGCARDHARDAQLYRDILDQTPPPPPELAQDPTGPLSLGGALALVNRRNEQLAIEGEAYVQSIIDRKRAVAEFLPTLSFSPAYRRSQGLSGPRRDRNDDYRDRLDLPLNLGWNLFKGYRDVAALYRDAATIRQREALLRDLESSLMLDVVDAFYLALRAERSIAVLESSLKLQEERVRDIRARRDTGIARPLDVAQTEAVASEARVSLITARQTAANARQALRLLLDTPIGERELVDDVPMTLASADRVEHWVALGLAHRQDLVAASAALEAARHDVDNAFGQYYPSVTLDLEYLLTFNRVASETGWNAVLRLHLPIFSAGRIEADVRTAWSRVRQAALVEHYARRRVEQQVATTFQDWQASQQRLAELNRKLEAASIAYEQADSSYSVGLATNLERLDAQDRLLLTELEIANEAYRLRETYLGLMRAAGQLDGRVVSQALPQTPVSPGASPEASPDASAPPQASADLAGRPAMARR